MSMLLSPSVTQRVLRKEASSIRRMPGPWGLPSWWELAREGSEDRGSWLVQELHAGEMISALFLEGQLRPSSQQNPKDNYFRARETCPFPM